MGNESMLSPSKGICCICCQGGGVSPQLPLHVPVTGPCISALHPALGNCCMTWGGVEKIPKPI